MIPAGTAVVTGFTAMDTTVAGVTVRRVDPFTSLSAAVIMDVPTERDVAKPAGLTLATAGLAELQLTEVVRSCWLPSVNVPVATNCCVVPDAMEGLAGLTAMDTRAAFPTVRVADPETVPD